MRAEDMTIHRREIGGKYVLTSPDVPELHISHADLDVARASIQPALDALENVKARLRARAEFRAFKRSQEVKIFEGDLEKAKRKKKAVA
jgi:hypothetical protein